MLRVLTKRLQYDSRWMIYLRASNTMVIVVWLYAKVYSPQ